MRCNRIIGYFKKLKQSFADVNRKAAYIPSYRVVEVSQDQDDGYIVTLQVINKNITFKAKPEEILANDNLVDQFSPRDVRTLTYLGYLGINSPKYKVLAKRLSENDDKLIFAIKQKGSKKVIIKSADEIIKGKNIIENLNSVDAHLVGYVAASESTKLEKRQKEEVVKMINAVNEAATHD